MLLFKSLFTSVLLHKTAPDIIARVLFVDNYLQTTAETSGILANDVSEPIKTAATTMRESTKKSKGPMPSNCL